MKKKLSVIEASAIITGYGIGSGALAMPYLVKQCGIPCALILLVVAYLASYLLHLMIADITVRKGTNSDVVGIITNSLPNGKYKKPLVLILFIILAVILYSNLAIYICGAADILLNIFGGSIWIYKILFYAFAAIVGMFGLKVLGISEKYAIFGVVLLELALFVGSLFHMENSLPLKALNGLSIISYFSLAMFAFTAFFSVPQVVIGLDKDVKKIKKAIALGMLINLCLMLVLTISSILASSTVSEVAIIGLGNSLGLWAKVIGSVFTVLIMLTSYWAIAASLKEMVVETVHLNKSLSFVLASVPSFLIAIIPSTSFMSFLELTSGAMAILVVLFLIPLFHVQKKEGKSILGKFATVSVELFVLISCLMMALGALL